MKTLKENERDHIILVLKEAQGNISKAAKTLGVARTTVYRKLKEHGIAMVTEIRSLAPYTAKQG